ncbi:MAG: glycoside hydrolase family 2 TIM barrel-domain containing protein [Eggerthellaceae bacterium]|nr:glycoside hydrolase family 2 TIM barrel-domain containing protein [Eggerthellaceae bacterium]
MLDFKRVLAAKPREHDVQKKVKLTTPWGEQLDSSAVLQEHPTPQFARASWQNLNGYWDYAITRAAGADDALPSSFDGKILVPFSPEAPLSGVEHIVQPDETLWYRRTVDVPKLNDGERLLLHFQAVDYRCTCFVDGQIVGSHTGGYLPFCFDITDALAENEDASNSRKAEVMLRVTDPSDTGTQLRGKQKLVPSDIWYTAQSGIWQTVWCEVVHAAHVVSLQIDADPKRKGIALHAELSAAGTLHVEAHDSEGVCAGMALAHAEEMGDTFVAEAFVQIENPHLWSPDDPYLYTLQLMFADDESPLTSADRVSSYTAFRTCEVHADEKGVPRFYLNGEQLLLKGVLDQGYWSDGLMTAPADEALVFDIQSARQLGFNMMRKHIKIESERWYYHCDRLGMLVWQDMVSGGGTYGKWYTSQLPTLFKDLWTRLSDEGPAHYAHFAAEDPVYRGEWRNACEGTIRTLRNHPCIVTWVLFNEAWGQFDARAMTDFARSLDATRPVDSTSGWYDQRAGDYFSVHNYFRELEVYPDPLREKTDDGDRPKRAFAISEFGGLTRYIPGHSSCEIAYGYDSYETSAAWFEALTTQLATMEVLEEQGLAAYVYTQLTDIEEETNGLLTYDRRINKVHEGLSVQ